MKSKYQTLKDVVAYVTNESDNPIDELLMMGFTPCQLVFEFGFDEEEVKTSELYDDDDDLEETEYPFVLDKYGPFDAALVNRFKLSSDTLCRLKNTKCYKEMKEMYEEEQIEALTDVLNEVFDEFEDGVYEELGEDFQDEI